METAIAMAHLLGAIIAVVAFGDSNHRYTTSPTIKAEMLARG